MSKYTRLVKKWREQAESDDVHNRRSILFSCASELEQAIGERGGWRKLGPGEELQAGDVYVSGNTREIIKPYNIGMKAGHWDAGGQWQRRAKRANKWHRVDGGSFPVDTDLLLRLPMDITVVGHFSPRDNCWYSVPSTAVALNVTHWRELPKFKDPEASQ